MDSPWHEGAFQLKRTSVDTSRQRISQRRGTVHNAKTRSSVPSAPPVTGRKIISWAASLTRMLSVDQTCFSWEPQSVILESDSFASLTNRSFNALISDFDSPCLLSLCRPSWSKHASPGNRSQLFWQSGSFASLTNRSFNALISNAMKRESKRDPDPSLETQPANPLSTFLSHTSISKGCPRKTIAHSVWLSFHQRHLDKQPPTFVSDVNVLCTSG